MDISIEPVCHPQLFSDADKPFHSIIGIPDHSGAEKQALNIISTVKFHCDSHDLVHRQGGAWDVIAPAVHAVSAIKFTVVREHDFQQRYASPVCSKTMADANTTYGVADSFTVVATYCATRGTRDVILGRGCKDFKFE